MSLRLVLGRAGCGKTRRCLDEILAKLAESPDGRPLILIVPEQATFEVERLLAAACPAGGFTRAYVLGFRRLAYRVLGETGGGARPHITELGKRMALSRILLEHKDRLKLLGRAAGERTFAETLAGLIKEFKNYGVKPEALAALADNQLKEGAEGPLGSKLSDLAFLYGKFEEFLKERYTDPEDYLSLLALKVPAAELIRQAEIWVDGFAWFTPQEYAVLAAILTTACSLTLTLCLSRPEEAGHRHQESLFHRQWDTRRKLLTLAGGLHIPVEEEELVRRERFSHQPILGYIEEFFAPQSLKVAKWDKDQAGLVVAEAANRRTETEAIAREMIRLSREQGFRWREMAVLLRDADNYRELMATVLADYDIPFFSDNSRPAVHHPLAELLRSSLDIILEKWSYEPVFRALKTDLLPVTRDEVDRLENYCLEFGIRGSRWTKPDPWTFRRRFSLDEDEWRDEKDAADEQENEFLKSIHDIRLRATEALIKFSRRLEAGDRHPAPVRDLVTAVYDLLVELNVPAALAEWAEAAEKEGDLEQAREHSQIWPAVMELLDQMAEAFAGQELSLTAFAGILGEGLEGLKLNLIPPGLDYVTVTALERTRRQNIKAAFVPGINDGFLPRRRKDEGLLTDKEREALLGQGVELAAGATADAFAEQFLVYTALTRSSHYLWLSYPLADAEGKALAPSLVIRRIREITGLQPVSYPVEPEPGREKEYIARTDRALALLAGALRLYKTTGNMSPVWWDVYNWAVRRGSLKNSGRSPLAGLFHHNQADRLDYGLAGPLYRKNNRLRGSVTRFENFRACPFRHFAQYGLGLKERAVHKLRSPDLGQFLHAVLKMFGDRVAAAGLNWSDVTYDQADVLCGEIVTELAPRLQNEILVSSRQHEHLLSRLERRAYKSICRLIDWAKVSRFKPLTLEQSFGRGLNALPPLAFTLADGSILELAGQIDRLDVAVHAGRKYALVIDYKSGGAWLSLEEVYYGLKLQLLTYLLVATGRREEALLPAGVLYCFLKNPTVVGPASLSPAQMAARANSQLKMPGWLLADPDVVKLLEETIAGHSEFFKVGLGAKGFYKNSLEQLKTAEEFSLLLRHAARELKTIGTAILAGDIRIRPYRLAKKSPCSYCPYPAVCQFDRRLPENECNPLPRLSDEAAMNLIRQALSVVAAAAPKDANVLWQQSPKKGGDE
ncbi:MAG TPA: helicase-exonuclease AddAB subunit AddB [Methylomusa anaerophila]|uniref:ATP-dependent helicase/deoxyribonuclease subunit B n=1 Tax=Methylomusa anaerophila TaxID=1930071 RepID=A0A348AHC2_9FIRM|nr:helicase-exonuclease AddAB subunit AddB [Methylomusa anaerophila]BBB90470.1 ATP-dependent helicase/deoxyribonuclease subunit B [Methylomusa anaerophila]HML89888.1 helicase-exonuclease AddAB subunit AddB [Methylomusa anaerophila]